MERTGHHSLDGVRSYKRKSNEQVMTMSDILNAPAKKRRSEECQNVSLKNSDLSKLKFNSCTNINIIIN